MKEVVRGDVIEASDGCSTVRAENSSNYIVHYESPNMPEELAHPHHLTGLVRLLHYGMLAIGFKRWACRSPNEVGATNSCIPEFAEAEVNSFSHVLEDPIVPTRSCRL